MRDNATAGKQVVADFAGECDLQRWQPDWVAISYDHKRGDFTFFATTFQGFDIFWENLKFYEMFWENFKFFEIFWENFLNFLKIH